MQSWEITKLNVEAHQPEVLASDGEGRVIVLELPAGEQLRQHQVHERAWLIVVSGQIEITGVNDEAIAGGAGLLAAFEPNERREVSAIEDSRMLLVLSPWPGVGHPREAGA